MTGECLLIHAKGKKSCPQHFQSFLSVHYKEGKCSHLVTKKTCPFFCKANPGNRELQKCANIPNFETDSKNTLNCKPSHCQTGFLIWNDFSRNLILQQDFQWLKFIGEKNPLFWKLIIFFVTEAGFNTDGNHWRMQPHSAHTQAMVSLN